MANKQKEDAISIKQLIQDQNKLLQEQLRIVRDQAGIDSDRLSEQQDIANVLKDQSKQLQFQKSEKSLILRTTNAINRIAEKNYAIGQGELGTLKGINQLAKDRQSIEGNIRNLTNLRSKILKDSVHLGKDEQKAQIDIANAIQDQIKEAILLNKNLENVENTSRDVQRNLSVKTFGLFGEISSAIPGLKQFAEPFTTAADASRNMVAGIENAAQSGGKGLTKERIKQLGLEKELNGLSGRAASQKLKGMSSMKGRTKTQICLI